jgi:curved DNA-binding protein
MRGARKQQGQRHQQMNIPGEDQHAKIVIDLSDAFHGTVRQLVLQEPQIDASGHVVMQERRLDVKIPKGVKEGQHIRLSGLGLPGMGSNKPGDLYLEVHFAPNDQYRIDGRDVFQKTPVTPWEAALGGEIEVATPDGKVKVTVPAGSQSGRKLRLKARGIPGKQNGDLYLVLDVVLPAAKTDRDREIYKMMANEMAFNPRQESPA